MSQMTTGAARVVDPVLTTQARGYKNADIERAGGVLFPTATVMSRGAKIVKFGKQAFRRYNSRRAPGASTKRIRVGYSDESVSLHQEALEGVVPREVLEESRKAPNVDLGRRAVNVPLESIAREKEIQQAAIAQDASNYDANHKETLAGQDQWDDYANSDPGAQSDDAHESVRKSTGRRANTLVLGPKVFLKVKRHPKIVGHFYSGVKDVKQSVSRAQIAEYFGITKVAIGDEVYMANADDDDADFTDVWGNVAILAYVPSVEGGGDIEVPSYGYTYQLSGHPMVEAGYFDKNAKSWIYPVTDEYQPVLTGMSAGYLFSNVLAAP